MQATGSKVYVVNDFFTFLHDLTMFDNFYDLSLNVLRYYKLPFIRNYSNRSITNKKVFKETRFVKKYNM